MFVAAAPFLVLHTISILLSLALSIAMGLLYARMTVGKPPGYMLHKLYGKGLTTHTLLEPEVINKKLFR